MSVKFSGTRCRSGCFILKFLAPDCCHVCPSAFLVLIVLSSFVLGTGGSCSPPLLRSPVSLFFYIKQKRFHFVIVVHCFILMQQNLKDLIRNPMSTNWQTKMISNRPVFSESTRCRCYLCSSLIAPAVSVSASVSQCLDQIVCVTRGTLSDKLLSC